MAEISSVQDNGSTESMPKTIVLVGLGMVGLAFVEKLLERDLLSREYKITILGEEKYLAYNRVGLADYFKHRSVSELYLNDLSWYESIDPHHMTYRVNEAVTYIDRENQTVSTDSGASFSYDILVLATGSNAVLPYHCFPNSEYNQDYQSMGVFVYRSIDDLRKMIDYAEKWNPGDRRGERAIVVGGGLLGLEAAKSLLDMEKFDEISVVHRSKWLLSQQLDDVGGASLGRSVKELGVNIRLSTEIANLEFKDGRLQYVVYTDGTQEACSLICFAIGIKPRDELAAQAGIEVAERGGIVVNDYMQTSVPNIYAVGECASWKNRTFGLIAPGVEMADVLTWNLTQQSKLHQVKRFTEPDLSTRLKLMGVDVASFGDYFADRNGPKRAPGRKHTTKKLTKNDVCALTFHDPFNGIYKKLIFSSDGKYLVGGILVGNVSEFTKLNSMVKSCKQLEIEPQEFIIGKSNGDEDDLADLDDSAQVCSCHNVSKGDIVAKIRDGTCTSIGEIKSTTKAGTACGGCESVIKSIFNTEMKAMGQEISNALCIHFSQSRSDLFNIIMVKKLSSFPIIMKELSRIPDSAGCEICKPTIGSILASLYNKNVMDTEINGLQDTNDRYLGNIQRNGTYSVIPRISGGEVTPEKLIALGQVASEYNLYSKITGAQRVDLFGAKKEDLPVIWKKLNNAGFESGHGYGKSLRTVKSCVGSSWCRYGIGDSVGLAVRLEERYKSLRSPHKLKGAVSGCVRDCAEFHNKDFGVCAVQNGFNLFVGGNGGMKPAHAQLLATDVLPDRLIPLIDRYLMFYIRTADRLQRTARWLESLPGGIEYLKDVIINDKLGICTELEEQMQRIVGSFFDEWKVAAESPEIRKKFVQFSNTKKRIETVEIVIERGQIRPADWPQENGSALEDFKNTKWSHLKWKAVCASSVLPDSDSGSSTTILIGDTQLAIFRLKGQLYSSQNMCGHKRAFVLSQGLLSTDENNEAYISCPLHKRNYALGKSTENSGACKNDSTLSVATFEVKELDGQIWLKLPPVDELDRVLGTEKWKVRKTESHTQFKQLDEKYVTSLPERAPVGTCGELPGNLSW